MLRTYRARTGPQRVSIVQRIDEALRAVQFLGFIDYRGDTQQVLHRWVNEPDARPAIMPTLLRETNPAVVALAGGRHLQQFRTEPIVVWLGRRDS